ncbi:TolC family protein [Methyloterricola oryzae]|uniref:TolC family protein n=1 Tax=Methyloterricola oryzae TaxID=1495050 RepID=UPI003F6979DC
MLGWPQESEPRATLTALIREAHERNPDIQAARQRWESGKAVIPQVQTLPDPKVILGYKDMNPNREVMYGMSQEVPFPGKLRLKGEIATRDAERMEQDYRAMQLAVIAQLKESFYDLHFVHDSIDVLGKTKLLLEEFEDTAESRYSVGQAAQQDVFRAQTEISRLLARLASLEQKRQSLHAVINRILNRLPNDPLAPPGEIEFTPLHHSPAELNALVDQSSPLLHGQQKTLERGDQSVALAKREYYPDFELDARGLHDNAMNTDGYQVMLNVKVPLYFATKQRQGVNEAVAGREASFQDLQALRQELLSRIKDNLAQAERAEKLVKLLRDAIIPQSRLTLTSAQGSYAVGKIDFLTLLNSLLTLQENELEFHSEVAEHEKAIARLEGIVGEIP